LISWIDLLLAGDFSDDKGFQLIIEDPTGNSAIIGEGLPIERDVLNEKEILDLTMSFHSEDVRSLDQTPL
jgi:C4-type Zn-finger protein